MTRLALIVLSCLPLLAQPRPGFLQPVEAHPGWYAIDGRVTPLIGAAADPALLSWPDQRVRDFLDTVARSGGNLIAVTPPAEPPAAEAAETDPWLRFQRLLNWTSQRRIVLAVSAASRPEPVQAKVRELAAAAAHVLLTPSPVHAPTVEAFWRALLSGSSVIAFNTWTFEARNSVRAARMISSFTPVWQYRPNDELLLDRNSAPAYASAKAEESYLVYLPKGGTVTLAAADMPHAIVWICLDTAEIEGHARPTPGGLIPLAAPDSRHWLALVSK
jgi:hypothetical protein